MQLVKRVLVIACASLLFLATVGAVRPAYAQYADESDQSAGAWGAPDPNSANPETKIKVPPINIKGCWSGDVVDSADGTGTATFQFAEKSNPKKLVIGSTFNFQWADAAFARGPVKGSVTSTGFKFKGNAGGGCKVSGTGTGDATALIGTFQFVGTCAPLFQDVTFSITPGCP